VIYSNIPTSHLEQLILLTTQGILTSHNDSHTLMKDSNLLDSFKAFGIDLAKLQLSTGSIEGQVLQGSSSSNAHGKIITCSHYSQKLVIVLDINLQYELLYEIRF